MKEEIMKPEKNNTPKSKGVEDTTSSDETQGSSQDSTEAEIKKSDGEDKPRKTTRKKLGKASRPKDPNIYPFF